MGQKSFRRMVTTRASVVVRRLGLGLLLLAASGPAVAAPAGKTIDIALIEGLRFGAMAVSAVPGTVTVTPEGSRSATGGLALMTSPSPGSAAFRVTVTGSGNIGVSVLLPTTITLQGPSGATMTVGSFTSQPADGFRTRAGETILRVGATLQINANQPPGAYSGTLEVIVNLGG